MTPEEHQKLKYHLKEISKLLYADTPSEQLKDFESIELSAREHLLKTVGPYIGDFFLAPVSQTIRDVRDK